MLQWQQWQPPTSAPDTPLVPRVLSQTNELGSHQTKKQDVISDQPHVLISFIHWVDRTIKRVTNSPAVAHKSWMVRCPRILHFIA